MASKWFVYKVEIDDIVRYIGFSGDIIRREKNHNYLCFKRLDKKILYEKIRSETHSKEIKLQVIKEFSKETDARRYECFLILKDYFAKKQLWQKVPQITDAGFKRTKNNG